MATFVLQEQAELPIVEEGEILPAVVTVCEERETPWTDDDGNKKMQISFTFKVTDGQYEGRIFYGQTPPWFNSSPNCKFRLWSQSILNVQQLPAGFTLDTDDLVNLPCRIVIGYREYEKNGQTVKRNFVADVIPESSSFADDVF